jgi:hypothetical protein
VAKEIIISPQGDLRAIHSPETEQVLRGVAAQSGSEVETRRASHVEPLFNLSDEAVCWLFTEGPFQDEKIPFDMERRLLLSKAAEHGHFLRRLLPKDKWWADMRPVRGPVLGPYDTKEVALDEEVKWLREHSIPVCEPCREALQSADEPARIPGSPQWREAQGMAPMTENCEHLATHDCMICSVCGECSESLDSNDVCTDCGGTDENAGDDG